MLPIIQPGARSLWPVVRLTSTAGALSQGGGGTPAPGAAPAAFTVGQWTLADNTAGNSLTITILAVPGLNGNTQTGTQYRIDGGAWQNTALVGLGDIVIVDGTDLPNDDPADIEIRVLVAEYDWDVDGTGDEDSVSDTKTATPTLVEAPTGLTYAFAGWITNDGIGGNTATASLDLGAAAADRFVLFGAMTDGDVTFPGIPLSLPLIVNEESWGRRAFYGEFVPTGSGPTSLTVTASANTYIRCPVFVIRGVAGLVVKAFEIGTPATVPVEAGDLVIAIELHDNTETWTNSPTEPPDHTYSDGTTEFWKGWAAVFVVDAPNAAFSPGMASGRGARTALIVLGESA